jgi:hypothetical protein
MSLVVVLGIGITVFGIGIDFFLPGEASGLDLPQFIFVVSGPALALAAALMRREGHRRRLVSRPVRSIVSVAIVTLATLLALEVLLSAAGLATYYPSSPADYELSVLPWWACGDAGCRYVYDHVQTAYAADDLKGRVCSINRQGYADSEDFALPVDWENRARIILLGDSFTWGMSADVGRSYAETLARLLPQAIIWNTGIPGTGANQARLVFDKYAPSLRPQLTVLGFVDNDFDDNLMPVDSWVNALDANNRLIHVRKYEIDDEERVIELDLHALGYIRAYGEYPPSSELERLLGATRLGTLLLRLKEAAAGPVATQEKFERRSQVTRQHLLQLKAAVAASGSELLVILAPRPADVLTVGRRFRMAEELMRELEIPYLNPIRILDAAADFAVPPDRHWSNSGHRKVGELLGDCVRRFFDRGNLSDCAHLALP